MRLANLLLFKLSLLAYPFYLWGRRRAGAHTVLTDGGDRITLREGTADAYVFRELNDLGGYGAEGFGVGPEDVVVDVGAHIGIFSVLAARKAVRGKVLAFEPVPENHRLLEQNREQNGLGNLKAFACAVSSHGRDVELNLSSSNTGGHSVFGVDSRASLKVPSVTLAGVLERNGLGRIGLLKIDAEGSEYDIVLNTPAEVFARVDRIVLEYHDYLDSRHSHRDLAACLRGRGFEVRAAGWAVPRLVFKTGLLLARRR